MSIYRELGPVPEYITQLAFKGEIQYTAKANIPNLA